MDASSDERQVLQAAIEHLYATFARYGLQDHIDGSPHTVGESDQAQLRSKALRELTPDDLCWYTMKAMTTWGSVEDFKHFLPRILELVTEYHWRRLIPDPYRQDADGQSVREVTTLDEYFVVCKLEHGRWSQWPEDEQDAVKQLLLAYWQFTLAANPELDFAAVDLCSVADGPWRTYSPSQDDESE
jgi:hypothetical protein